MRDHPMAYIPSALFLIRHLSTSAASYTCAWYHLTINSLLLSFRIRCDSLSSPSSVRSLNEWQSSDRGLISKPNVSHHHQMVQLRRPSMKLNKTWQESKRTKNKCGWPSLLSRRDSPQAACQGKKDYKSKVNDLPHWFHEMIFITYFLLFWALHHWRHIRCRLVNI